MILQIENPNDATQKTKTTKNLQPINLMWFQVTKLLDQKFLLKINISKMKF